MKFNQVAFGVAAAIMALAPAANADVTLSGHVNRAVMYADDGMDTDTFFVDPETSPTLINITGEHDLNSDVTVGAQLEVRHSSNNSYDVTIGQTSDPSVNSFEERMLEVYFRSKTMGTLWLGQGETASENTSEYDLNDAWLAGTYSYTGDFGGSIAFRDSAGNALTTIGVVSDNFDGLARDDRIRYDTPEFYGAMLSVSTATAEQWDVALKYGASFGDFEVAAAVAYANGGDAYGWEDQYNGSLAFGYQGFTLTLAGGGQSYGDDRDFGDVLDDVDVTDPLSTFLSDDDPMSYYAKLGYSGSVVPWGKTSFAVDYKYTENVAVVDDEYTSYGLGIVQAVDAVSTEFYLGLRNHELERVGVTDIEDVFTLVAGARVKF